MVVLILNTNRLQLGLAAEYYKYPQGYTNSGLGVLATAGLDLMLF